MRTLSLEENGGERTVAGMEDRDDTVTDNCSDAPVVRDLMIVDPAGYDVARQRCLTLIAQAQPPQDGKRYCCPLWDGWGCWPNYTEAGRTAFIQCPRYLRDTDEREQASRHCGNNGYWWNEETNKPWSDYRPCVDSNDFDVDKLAIYTFIFGYSMSIFALSAALLLFLLLRIKSERVTIHKHLFISYVLSGFAWIVYYCGAVLRADVLATNPVWCQALHVLTQYLVTSNFFWMFCEGFVLHTKIVVPFFISIKRLLCWCFIMGWGLPALPAGLYAAVRLGTPTHRDITTMCWIHESDLAWIVMVPIICTILANLAFLASIIRVMLTKMKAMHSSEVLQMRKATRAVLVLTPLLGLQYILFPFRLKNDEATYVRDAVLVASAAVTSFQGFLVAIIFCFANGEVISVVQARWRRRDVMTSMVGGVTGGWAGHSSHTPLTTSINCNFMTSGTSPVTSPGETTIDGSSAEMRFFTSLASEGLLIVPQSMSSKDTAA